MVNQFAQFDNESLSHALWEILNTKENNDNDGDNMNEIDFAIAIETD